MFSFLEYRDISEEIFTAPRTYRNLNRLHNHLGADVDDLSETPAWIDLLLRPDGEWNRHALGYILGEFNKLSLIQNFARSQTTDSTFRHFSLHPLVRDWIQFCWRQSRYECLIQATMVVKNCLKGLTLSLQAKEQIRRHMNACQTNVEEFIKARECTPPMMDFLNASIKWPSTDDGYRIRDQETLITVINHQDQYL
jgi:hypothetical protein